MRPKSQYKKSPGQGIGETIAASNISAFAIGFDTQHELSELPVVAAVQTAYDAPGNRGKIVGAKRAAQPKAQFKAS
jgi:hypothetical protein